MCDRPIQRDEVFRLILEIHGPKSEDEMKRFREALRRLLEAYKVTQTELRQRVE
jgi:hypothetical protein